LTSSFPYDEKELLKDQNALLELVKQLFQEIQAQREEIEAQREEIEAQREEIEKLKNQLVKYTSPHIPSSKQLYPKKKAKQSGMPRKPTRKRGGSDKGKSGITWDQKEADETIDRFVKTCAGCGDHIDQKDQELGYTKRVLEIPEPVKVQLYEYYVHQARCQSCGKDNMAPAPTLPSTSLGLNLLTLINTTRYRTGGSFENLAQLIADHTQISPSQTAIQRGYAAVCDVLETEAEKITKEVMNSDWFHADETGHKLVEENSKEGGSKKIWVWNFSTPTATSYLVEDSRSHKVLDKALSYRHIDRPPPIAVCDCYPAYLSKFEVKQFCWAHLLRDSKEFEDHCLVCKMLHDHLVDQFQKVKGMHSKLRNKDNLKGVSKKVLQQALVELKFEVAEAGVRQCLKAAKLAKRIDKRGRFYLTCLVDPRIPMTNNHAERLLKAVILHRGNGGKPLRSKRAMKQYANLLTVLTTWKLQNRPLGGTLREYLEDKISHSILIEKS